MKKKSRRKTLIIGLLLIALVLSTATFAYWASFVEGTQEASSNQLTIGSADSVDTIFELSNDFNSGGYLVPLNQLENSPLGSVDEINLTYDINWIEDEDTAMLDGTIVEGELDITHTVFILTNNGVLDHVRYSYIYDLIHVNYNQTNPETLILNGDSSSIAFSVTIDEPDNISDYNLIANHSINIAFQFKIADSKININDVDNEPNLLPNPNEDSNAGFIDESTPLIDENTTSSIILNGSNHLVVELGSDYVDLGATAYDSNGDEISHVWHIGYVNTWEIGTYSYQYFSYSSIDYKILFSEDRVIEVVDTTAPQITINGDENFVVEVGTYFNDWGAYATDLSGSVEVVVEGVESVDINQVGVYTITYTATDSSGNIAIATRTVEVVEVN